jgi:hypothetical protein
LCQDEEPFTGQKFDTAYEHEKGDATDGTNVVMPDGVGVLMALLYD